MVGALRPLIRMKLAVLRHSRADERAATANAGTTIVLLLAAGTIWLATLKVDHPSDLADLLALVFALWALGWVLGPVLLGGQTGLRPSQFTLLPIPRLQLTIGLLGAAMIGITTASTLLAFASLVIYAARHGPAPVAVALPAALLQLVLVVLLSQLAISLFGGLMRSRLGGALTGMITGTLLVVCSSGWIVIIAIDRVRTTGFSPTVSTLLRALPSSWAVVAVDAARRSDWPVTTVSLAGLIAVVIVVLMAWSRLIESPRRARATILGSRGTAQGRTSPLRGSLPAGGTGAVLLKELRTWWRDPARVSILVAGPSFALMSCLIPLAFGSAAALPWAAPGAVLMAAATSANLYGQDGTALWMTLLTPGAERHDVRGRQWAWLAIFAPMTIVIAVVFTPLSGQAWAWPWVLALLPALLGGGAGLVVWTAVTQLVPGSNPRRQDNPLEGGDTTAQGFFVIFAGLLATVPAGAVVLAGTLLDDALLRWAGAAVGVGSGALLAWLLGRMAYRRLEVRGPDLLQLMRSGRRVRTTAGPAGSATLGTMRAGRSAVLWLSVMLGSLALFPQGIVPLVFKLAGTGERLWFLALYLPEFWQWPAIVAMIALGLVAYGIALHVYRAHKSSR